MSYVAESDDTDLPRSEFTVNGIFLDDRSQTPRLGSTERRGDVQLMPSSLMSVLRYPANRLI
jgi:hypothetical protein